MIFYCRFDVVDFTSERDALITNRRESASEREVPLIDKASVEK